jgi:hypothetical protein
MKFVFLFCFVDVKDSNPNWIIIIPLIITCCTVIILIGPACFGVPNFVVYIKGNYPY